MEYKERHCHSTILQAIQGDCTLESMAQKTTPPSKNLHQIIAMYAIGNILFVLLYAILFIIWIVLQSYPLTLISLPVLFFIVIPALNRRVSLFGIFLMSFFILDLTFSSVEARKDMNEILAKKCIDINDWKQTTNDDVLQREVPRYFGVKRNLFYRKSSKIIHIAVEPGMSGMVVHNGMCASNNH